MYERDRSAHRMGAWCIVFGVVSIVTGVAKGVGCLVVAGKLLSR